MKTTWEAHAERAMDRMLIETAKDRLDARMKEWLARPEVKARLRTISK